MTEWLGIDWARPEWLAGFMLVPVAAVVIVWSAKRRRRALDAFAEESVRGRTQALPLGLQRGRAALLIIALAGLVIASAGPRWGTEQVEALPTSQEIVFALDVSRSMLAEDVSPNRLDRAKLAIRQLMAVLPAAESGLVVFAGQASLVVPMTPDAGALELYLASVGSDWISDPSTDLGGALSVALDAFGPARAPGRAIVILSDGEDHGRGVGVATRAVKQRGIEVHAIGLGSTDGARIPAGDGGWLESEQGVVTTRLEREALLAVTSETEGSFVELGDDGEALAPLAGRLRSLDTDEESERGSERRADRYRWPLALAVVALGFEAIVGLGSRRRRLGPVPVALVIALVVGMGRATGPEEMYEEGRYSDALTVWRHADRAAGAEPKDSYNRGNAAYRLGEHREAAGSYAVAARTVQERKPASEAWYNAGNARFRIAEEEERRVGAESQRFWDSTVAAYREALLRDPNDQDAKHNLELALRRRQQASGGGGGGGASGGGGGQGGGPAGGGRGMQPPSVGGGQAPEDMTQAEAERLLDALAAQEREALVRGEGDERASRSQRPGW